jgi:hypothetical protein
MRGKFRCRRAKKCVCINVVVRFRVCLVLIAGGVFSFNVRDPSPGPPEGAADVRTAAYLSN